MSLLIIFAKRIGPLILRLYNQLIVNILIIEESFLEFIILEFFFLLFVDFSSISGESLIIEASLFKVLRLSELGKVLFLEFLGRKLPRLRE
jgi:hypothetical protein